MKRIVKVSLGRMAYTLEEDAYTLLQNYLDKLSAHYAGTPNGNEIVDGIEERIGELLSDRGYREKIAGIPVIREIIVILGEPEDIDAEGGAPSPRPVRRRLYRHPDQRIVAGICSGLGARFNTDPILFRLIFALGFVLTFILGVQENEPYLFIFPAIYLVLWLCMPKARTLEQRCEMMGESPSIPDLEKNLRENRQRYGTAARKLADNGTDWLVRFGHLLARIAGGILLLSGIGLLLGLILTLFGISAFFPLFPIIHGCGLVWLEILTLAVCAIPCIGIIYAGILLLFRLQPPRWKPGLILFLAWLVLLAVTAGALIHTSRPFWNYRHINSRSATVQQPDTLHIVFEQEDGTLQYPILREKGHRYHIRANGRHYEWHSLDLRKDSFRYTAAPSIYVLGYESDEWLEEHPGQMRIFENYVCREDALTLSELGNERPAPRFWRMSGDTLYLRPVTCRNLEEAERFDVDISIQADRSRPIIVRTQAGRIGDETIVHEFNEGNRIRLSNLFPGENYSVKAE